MRARTGIGVAFLVCLLVAAPARAATIPVTTTNDELKAGDGQCSLREAISTVNGKGNGDCTAAGSGANTIELGAQTYPLTLGPLLLGGGGASGCVSTYVTEYNDNTRDELSVAGSVHGLTIEGAGPTQTVIDACKLGDRALEVNAGATVTLRGLTITNGHARDGAPGKEGELYGSAGEIGGRGVEGGGILNKGTLALLDCAITDNHAGNGGNGGMGDHLGGSGGPGNSGGPGGGIFSTGTLTVSDTTISGNAAGNGGAGGSGWPGTTINMLSGNGGAGGSGGNGGGGGGLAIEGGTATITGSTITGNRTGTGGTAQPGQESDQFQGVGGNGGNGGLGGSGAGIAVAGSKIVHVPLQATNDTIAGNVTGDGTEGRNAGAGVGGEDGVPGNGGNGGNGGGLIAQLSTTVQLTNVTVAQNSTGKGASGGAPDQTYGNGGTPGSQGNGGGIYSQFSSPTLQNTLLNDNEPGGDCRGAVTDGGHNLIFSPPSIGPKPSEPCTVTNFLRSDPKLAPLAGNGGPTQTMRLQPGSAAIDQVPASGAGCPATDQRGVARPGGAACDIGAYEAAPPSATTLPAAAVTATTATLSATVIANGPEASAHFEYGTTTGYGKPTADQHAAGITAVPVSAPVTGLKPGTTYHYRVVADSIDGTANGGDGTFKARLPAIQGLKIRPKRARSKRGVRVTYIASDASTTELVLSRCSKHGKKHRTRCKSVRSVTHRDVAGRNGFRLHLKGLKPGRYLVTATPALDGVKGRTVKAKLKVVGSAHRARRRR